MRRDLAEVFVTLKTFRWLAVLVPVLSHFGLVSSDDMTGAFVISSVLVISVGLMIFRPGSALNRHFER